MFQLDWMGYNLGSNKLGKWFQFDCVWAWLLRNCIPLSKITSYIVSIITFDGGERILFDAIWLWFDAILD